MSPSDTDADREAKQAQTREDFKQIVRVLDEFVTRKARALGWSAPDAKMIVESATVEFFSALTREEPVETALPNAFAQAEHKHLTRYVTLMAQDGKVSAQQALAMALAKRLDRKIPRQNAALQVALKTFDQVLRSTRSLPDAMDAARSAAFNAMRAAA